MNSPSLLLVSGVACLALSSCSNHRSGVTPPILLDQWMMLSPAASPSARMGHAMAFDEQRARLVLFGGYAQSASDEVVETRAPSDETWEWDQMTWRRIDVARRPSARANHVMTYDSVRGRVVLHGGSAKAMQFFTDTWEWDGVTWNEIKTASVPPPRVGAGFAFDRMQRRAILAGGTTDVIPGYRDTWAFDGDSWEEIGAGVEHDFDLATLSWDAQGQRILALGQDLTSQGSTLRFAAFEQGQWRVLPPPPLDSDAWVIGAATVGGGELVALVQPRELAADEPQTWRLYADRWTLYTTASPPSRVGAAMSSAFGTVLLFGGLAAPPAGLPEQPLLADTWIWLRRLLG